MYLRGWVCLTWCCWVSDHRWFLRLEVRLLSAWIELYLKTRYRIVHRMNLWRSMVTCNMLYLLLCYFLTFEEATLAGSCSIWSTVRNRLASNPMSLWSKGGSSKVLDLDGLLCFNGNNWWCWPFERRVFLRYFLRNCLIFLVCGRVNLLHKSYIVMYILEDKEEVALILKSLIDLNDLRMVEWG